MSNSILAKTIASVPDSTKNPLGTVALGEGFRVATATEMPPRFTASFAESPTPPYQFGLTFLFFSIPPFTVGQ